MKTIKYFTLFFLIALISSNLIYADETKSGKVVHYGPTIVSNQNIADLTIYGPAAISGSTIQLATLKGPVKAANTSFDTVNIEGMAKFDNVKVSNELHINGLFKAQNSNINQLSIASHKLKLSNSNIKNLIVRNDSEDTDPQVVYLANSKIDTLTFEAKNGKVILADSNSSVTKLEGGKIESKAENSAAAKE